MNPFFSKNNESMQQKKEKQARIKKKNANRKYHQPTKRRSHLPWQLHLPAVMK
jgi:hypothetical protein